MIPRIVQPFTLLFVLAGCASQGEMRPRAAGPGSSITTTSTGVRIDLEESEDGVVGVLEADAARVRSLLPVAYEALGIAAGALDASGSAWGNTRFTGSRIGGERVDRYVRCGSDGTGVASAGSYRTRLSIVTRVEPQGSGLTRLTTAVSGQATTVEGTSTGASRCVSNGQLEELIAVTIRGLLEAG